MKFIIIGAGNVGLSLAKLLNMNHDVVVIERDEVCLAHIPAELDLQTIKGNGCSPEVLLEAGIATADYLVAVASIDEVNITACLAARLLNPTIKRIGRVRTINFNHPLICPERLAETFDLIIDPDQEGAKHLLQMFRLPGAREVMDFAEGKLKMVSFEVEADSDLDSKNLLQIGSYTRKFPFLVIAVVRGNSITIPSGKDVVQAGDVVYCISEDKSIKHVLELGGKKGHKARTAMVWAGTDLARVIAHELSYQGVKVKLLLSEVGQEELEEFTDTMIFKAQGTDPTFLVEENISDVDVFISATPEEEGNVLSALLAKKLGARQVMAAINDLRYQALVGTVGVDVVVSTHSAAAAAIVRHIHSDAVINEVTLHDGKATFVELTTLPDMSLIGKPFKEIKFPRDMLIASIVRKDEVMVPDGDSALQEGDRCVIFVLRKAIPEIEKLFNVRLETK